jgi:hypothetical protein
MHYVHTRAVAVVISSRLVVNVFCRRMHLAAATTCVPCTTQACMAAWHRCARQAEAGKLQPQLYTQGARTYHIMLAAAVKFVTVI